VLMTRITKIKRNLLDASLGALNNAYTLWGFKVGAAVLAEDGRIYEGCNVESWVSGLGTCAERCAINNALVHGNRKVQMVGLVFSDDSSGEPRPCGACLQYISDFSDDLDIKIVMARARKGKILMETVKTKKLGELLPFAYKK